VITTSCYELKLENDQLLQTTEFVRFCINNQGKDIVLTVNNEGHCLTYCGVYDILDMFKFNSVKLLTANVLEKHNRYIINSSAWQCWLTNINDFDFSYDYTWNKKKIFGCFYGRPSAPRLGIASHLAKHYNDKSLIRIKFDFTNQNTRKLFDIQQLFTWDPSIIETIDLLDNQQYFGTQHYEKGKYKQANILSHQYKNFLIDLVVEPVCQGITFYPTEKIVRPMLCRRPFILMGSKNYLDYLHQLGFYTFNEFWSEEYDGFDGADRYFKIIKLINDLSTKSADELLDLYYEMTYQLEHNYKLLTTQSYTKKITLINE
jgi:hypothetical protein